MFEDKEFLYSVLPAEWENMVREYDGVRLPGPVNIQAIEYGGIDDQSGQEIVMRPDSPLWTYVIVRISGPAMRL
jgi:hypothetical protein